MQRPLKEDSVGQTFRLRKQKELKTRMCRKIKEKTRKKDELKFLIDEFLNKRRIADFMFEIQSEIKQDEFLNKRRIKYI